MPKNRVSTKKRSRRTPDQQIADLEAQIEELRGRAKLNKQFSPAAVLAERKRLELSAADYGDLVGVSHLTIYAWEKGRSKPRPAQLERWLEVKGIGKKAAWEELGIELARHPAVDVARERERLELSAANYGELVGVSAITIYNWEKGRTSPQQAQREKLEEVAGIKKKDAWKRLGITERGSVIDVVAERERLELSAADYGELVGVSALTIYNWEKGKTKPQQAQREKLDAVSNIRKEEAWERLGIEGEFSPEAVAAERERLELSAADYGELVGVSGLTIYNWEKSKSRPQAKQLDKWLAVKGIGKRKAWKQLGF